MRKGGSNPSTLNRLPTTEFHLNTAILVQQAESADRARRVEGPSSWAVRIMVQATSS